MNSIKSKSNNYTAVNDKAVGGAVLVPDDNNFIGYVAWEWLDQADENFFAIIKKNISVADLSGDWINKVADYGEDVTHLPDARALFPNLF